MKGFHLSTGASTVVPENIKPMKFAGGILQPSSDVAIDMNIVKKTQNKGFARIAKLVSTNQTAAKKKDLEEKDENGQKRRDPDQKRE